MITFLLFNKAFKKIKYDVATKHTGTWTGSWVEYEDNVFSSSGKSTLIIKPNGNYFIARLYTHGVQVGVAAGTENGRTVIGIAEDYGEVFLFSA